MEVDESTEDKEERDTARQLKNKESEFKEQKEAEAKKVTAMVKNIQAEHQNKITALQKQLAKMEETNKEVLEELMEERVDRIAALEAENSEIKEAKKELEAKTEQLKAENTELKREHKKHIIEKCAMEKTTKLVAELQGAVECPVCLVVPREGPVPCCPSGHITCSPCLERMRGEGKEECPTCRVPMGEGKSLLAKVVIEHMGVT